MVIWINGLAGAGKTTTAKALCAKLEELHAKGELKSKGVIYTDGDDFREVFEHSFGYSKEARINLTRKKNRSLRSTSQARLLRGSHCYFAL